MVKRLTAVAVAVLAACSSTPPAAAPGAIPQLAGRTAGTPQSCVTIHRDENLVVVDSRTVLYGSGKTVWLNHLRTECPGMNRMNILVTEPHGGQYCSGDTVRSLDPVSRVPGPTCVLGDFVPYSL
jgi:hypothetical protein